MKTLCKMTFFPLWLRGTLLVGVLLASSLFAFSMPSAQAAGFEVFDGFGRPASQQFWGISSSGVRWKGDANVSKAFAIEINNVRDTELGFIYGSRGSGVTYNALLGGSYSNGYVHTFASLSNYDGGTLGVMLRWKDNNNWYKAFLNGSHLIIEKRVAGKFIHLKAVAFAASPHTEYEIDFAAQGQTLKALVRYNGFVKATAQVNDSSLTSGVAGIRVDVPGTTFARFEFFAAHSDG